MLILLALATGSFWVYPKHVAQGWDGTLAHLPYYELRNQMITFIDEKKIPYENIGTEFPNKGAFDFYDLSQRTEGFAEKDFETNDYIFYSNVMNDFTDEELHQLGVNWQLIKSFKRGFIEVNLYKNPKIK